MKKCILLFSFVCLCGCQDQNNENVFRKEITRVIESNATYAYLSLRASEDYLDGGDLRGLNECYDMSNNYFKENIGLISFLRGVDLCLLGDFAGAADALAHSLDIGRGTTEALALYFVCMEKVGDTNRAVSLREKWDLSYNQLDNFDRAIYEATFSDTYQKRDAEGLLPHEVEFLKILHDIKAEAPRSDVTGKGSNTLPLEKGEV